MKRTISMLALAALCLAPAAAEAQLALFGGQQTWTYDGGASYTGTGGGVGLRSGILPLFDIAVDASYFAFPEEEFGEGGTLKLTSLNYAASAILGSKKERINLYAGIGQYTLRGGDAEEAKVGMHAGAMLHLFGALSADARVIMLNGDDSAGSTRIIPITLRLQF